MDFLLSATNRHLWLLKPMIPSVHHPSPCKGQRPNITDILAMSNAWQRHQLPKQQLCHSLNDIFPLHPKNPFPTPTSWWSLALAIRCKAAVLRGETVVGFLHDTAHLLGALKYLKNYCFSLVRLGDQWKPSWWFQPIWKILVKLDNFPKQRWKKTHLKPPPWNYIHVQWAGVFFIATSMSVDVLDGLNQPPAASKWWQRKTLLMSAFLLDEAIAYFNIETHTPNNYIQYIICNFLALVALIIDQFYAIHLSPCAPSHRPSAWPQHLFGETTLRSHRARQCGWPREFSKTHKFHPETIIKWWNSWIYRCQALIYFEKMKELPFSQRISLRSSLVSCQEAPAMDGNNEVKAMRSFHV